MNSLEHRKTQAVRSGQGVPTDGQRDPRSRAVTSRHRRLSPATAAWPSVFQDWVKNLSFHDHNQMKLPVSDHL